MWLDTWDVSSQSNILPQNHRHPQRKRRDFYMYIHISLSAMRKRKTILKIRLCFVTSIWWLHFNYYLTKMNSRYNKKDKCRNYHINIYIFFIDFYVYARMCVCVCVWFCKIKKQHSITTTSITEHVSFTFHTVSFLSHRQISFETMPIYIYIYIYIYIW